MRAESSAVEQEAPADASFEGTNVSQPNNVSSIASARRAHSVDDLVKAYFDALVTREVPQELEQLVMGMR